MKRALIIITFLTFRFYSYAQHFDSIPSKIIISKTFAAPDSGLQNLEIEQDSLITNEIPTDQVSKAKNVLGQMNELIKKAPDSRIILEIKNDSIWRYQVEKEKVIGDYIMIEKGKGVLNYYSKDKSICYKKYDLFDNQIKIEILEHKEDRKVFNGLDTFKITLIVKQPFSDLGNTIYEMYVTNKLNLPAHSYLNLPKYYQNLFPLEVISWEENLPGIIEKYEVTDIIY